MDEAVASALTSPPFNIVRMGGIRKHLGVGKDDGEGLVMVKSAPELCWGSGQDFWVGCFNGDSVHGGFGLAPTFLAWGKGRKGRKGRMDVGHDTNEGMGGCPVAAGFDWVEIF